ncbi:MAG: hypothetical protein WCJ58_07440 [bacterium]
MKAQKESLNAKIKKVDELLAYFDASEKEFELEKDIAKYQEAMELINDIKQELTGLELKINEIKVKYED